MKALVIGAGVIGCFLAHTLCRAGQEVSLLARGEWKEQLEKNGLTIRHYIQRKTTVDHPHIIGAIDFEQRYDAVFAVMQYQQMKNILDELSKINSPLVVLVGNNLSSDDMERYIQEHTAVPKTVLFGFQTSAGHREKDKVICARFGNGSMTCGGSHSEASDEIKAKLKELFKGTKYKLEWMPDMDGWCKCHAAFILPTAYLCYITGCNLKKSDSAQRKLLLDAAIEGYSLLSALNIPILPPGDEEYLKPGIKRSMMSAVIFAMAKTAIGKLAASDHCRNAVTEMEALDAAFQDLKAKLPDFPMRRFDALRSSLPSWEEIHKIYDKN